MVESHDEYWPRSDNQASVSGAHGGGGESGGSGGESGGDAQSSPVARSRSNVSCPKQGVPSISLRSEPHCCSSQTRGWQRDS